MLKKYRTIYLFLFSFFASHVQADNRYFIPSAGLSYQGVFAAEAGFIYGSSGVGSSCFPIHWLTGVKLASEFYATSDYFYIAPKVGYEVDAAIFGGRVNIIDYTDFTYHDFKFTPEIGIVLADVVTLFYGYNIPLNNSRVCNVGTHRVTLTFNFDKQLW